MLTKEEQKKISPAIVIIPVALGLGAVGVTAAMALAGAGVGIAKLYGKVTDSSTGAAIPDVKVTLDEHTTSTDSQGSYSFSGLAPGTYNVIFEKEGYMPLSGHDIVLVAGTNELNVSLTPTMVAPITATLYGTVTDAQTGLPLAGVAVTVDGLKLQYTDSNGYYIFQGLTPGSYTVTFEKAGYNTETR